MFVKVCGLRNLYDVENAMKLGFDAYGIVLTKNSKRFVDFSMAESMVNFGKGEIKSVAVAYDFSEIEGIYEHFDYIQLYNHIEKDNLIFSSDNEKDIEKQSKYFLFDKSHGKGKFSEFPKTLLKIRRKLIIAGGLNPDNVSEIIENMQPFGVDVSSGVEKYGIKDFELMKKFIYGAKNEN